MSTIIENVSAIAKSDLRGKNFTFFAVEGVGDVYVPSDLLGRCGFEIIELHRNDDVELDYKIQNDGRLRATWIGRIADKVAPVKKAERNESPKPVSASKATPTVVSVKPKKAVYEPRSWTRKAIDRNGDRYLVKVTSPSRKITMYEIENRGQSGEVISTDPLGEVTLAAAREALGKHIVHPEAPNAGKKTNDPTVSRSMKGTSSGGGQSGGKKGK
ncbi:MAG: hypothetical protein RLZZ480_717 [Candidatus Parcubacteria bacterium]|jgi:hypothetical protein